MQTEVEAKFLNVNHDEIRARLKKLSAQLKQPVRLMRRNNFDYPDMRLEKIGGWVRVRDEGDKITLSYKQLNDRTLHGTKEVNLIVNDYKKTCEFLTVIGLQDCNYQETKRETWQLDNVQIELDEWPWIKSFIEIEANNEEDLKKVTGLLGLELNNAVHGSVEIAYQAEYDVSEAEVDAWPKIKFSEPPEWLEKRRKK